MISSNDELIIIEIDMRRICNHDKNNEISSKSSIGNSSSDNSTNDNLHACYIFFLVLTLFALTHTHTHISTFNNNQCSVCSQTSNLIPTHSLAHSHFRKVFVIDVCCFQLVRDLVADDARFHVDASHSFTNSTADIVEKKSF